MDYDACVGNTIETSKFKCSQMFAPKPCITILILDCHLLKM